MSRETATIFGRGTILEPSTSHIGQGVALVAQTAAFVYIYVRISQIVEMTLSFHATFFVYNRPHNEYDTGFCGDGQPTKYGPDPLQGF